MMEKLEIIVLGRTRLLQVYYLFFPRFFSHLFSLFSYTLDDNNFTGPIPSELGKLKHLREIWLFRKCFSFPFFCFESCFHVLKYWLSSWAFSSKKYMQHNLAHTFVVKFHIEMQSLSSSSFFRIPIDRQDSLRVGAVKTAWTSCFMYVQIPFQW